MTKCDIAQTHTQKSLVREKGGEQREDGKTRTSKTANSRRRGEEQREG